MSRRSTPERLSSARRFALVERLVSERGELRERAEAKVSAWEAATAQDGRPQSGAYWGCRLAGHHG